MDQFSRTTSSSLDNCDTDNQTLQIRHRLAGMFLFVGPFQSSDLSSDFRHFPDTRIAISLATARTNFAPSASFDSNCARIEMGRL
ncbi:hypothetical protein NL676_000492 [Syzygium grande]|nr:hypothetical protein NL676_000492 [Syzygium grande]